MSDFAYIQHPNRQDTRSVTVLAGGQPWYGADELDFGKSLTVKDRLVLTGDEVLSLSAHDPLILE